MSYRPNFGRQQPTFRIVGPGESTPRDLVALIAVLFVTYSLQFFESTSVIPALLRLTPAVLSGFVWQLGTYPFVGYGGAGLWFLLELLILFWFGRTVFVRLGRRRFWQVVAWSVLGAAVAAVLVQLIVLLFAGGIPTPVPFHVMQGQRVLLAVTIAAFATISGESTILLFFVLPVRAKWFLWLEILFAFIAFLETKDLAGFVGICAAVLITFTSLSPGGPRWALRTWRRRMEEALLRARMGPAGRRRRFRVIDGDRGDRGGDDGWVH